MSIVSKSDYIGISKHPQTGKQITIYGSPKEKAAITELSKFGLITFSKEMQFKSSKYCIHFYKPVAVLQNLYNLGNEVLVLCCNNAMNGFISRTKDFLDYLLSTREEYKNRLDKITCIVIDDIPDITSIVKTDRVNHPDARLIIPFSLSEFKNGIDEDFLQNRFRDFLYERDLFSVVSPLKDDIMFFGQERIDVISELYGKYKQGENGGLFGLRRIGKTSILNLLKNRINKNHGAAVYIDCSQHHNARWNVFLNRIINRIVDEYSYNDEIQSEECCLKKDFKLDDNIERYNEDTAKISFSEDIEKIYRNLGNTRILLIFDEIESIGYNTSPSKQWREENDALDFWEAIRSLSQTNSDIFAFLVAGVNPMCVELSLINDYQNPIFASFNPIYVSLFDYQDVKDMVSGIGGHIGLGFDETVYSKLIEDYGGHPFLTRQVCSRINKRMLKDKLPRPARVTRNYYDDYSSEYQQDMVNVIDQILGVLKKYYPNEYELLKTLALDGKQKFKNSILDGDKKIQHLLGYCLLDKENNEYYIRIKSIERYLQKKYINEKTLDSQFEIRERINRRRDYLEAKLRELIWSIYFAKYGKKAKERIIEILKKNSLKEDQERKMKAADGKKCLEETFFNQLKWLMDNDWKSFAAIFPDKSKYEAFFDTISDGRRIGAHTKSIAPDDEALYNIAFNYFEQSLEDL